MSCCKVFASAHCPKDPDPARPLIRQERKFAAVFLLLLLSACATRHGLELPELSDWERRQAVLSATTRWEFSGRIGVSAGKEGFNGKLWWWQRDDIFRATVSGPLGIGTIRIDGDGHRITVTDKDGQLTEMQDAEIELRAKYGWTIPVSSLRFWALGIPDPVLPAETEFAEDGQLSRLRQGNWTVEIPEYREGGGQLMPRRISAINKDARIRMVIDNWIFN